MRITNVEAWSVTMPLREPYQISYESVATATNVFVRIATDRGLRGFGCAAPVFKVTGETTESVLQQLQCAVEPLLHGQDPLRIALHLEELRRDLRDHPSTLAAVDMALFDLAGKRAELPLWKLMGGYRQSIKTSVTIGILPEKETIELARRWLARGFTCLKIKGGLDVEGDAARVVQVRQAVGDDVELRYDANQGFDAEQTLRFVRLAGAARLELIEQPTPRSLPELLGQVTRQTRLPIMADESMMNLRDAYRLVRGDLADMINVKLMKVGGIDEALQVNALAKAAGLDVMVGCMDESALSIAAGLHFALARPNVVYADLDGHLDLVGDPAAGGVQLRAGILYPNDLPGLGVNLPD